MIFNTGTLSFNTTQVLAENISNEDNILAASGTTTFGTDDNGILLVTDAGDNNLPKNSTVIGLEFYVTAFHSSFTAASDLHLFATIDAGTSYSNKAVVDTTTSSATYTVTKPQLTYGTTWGLDWSGFTDLNQLGVKLTTQAGLFDTNSIAYVSLIQAKIYYKISVGKISLNSGKFNLSNGKIKL